MCVRQDRVQEWLDVGPIDGMMTGHLTLVSQ
jgi:hypothetical protein